MFLLAQWLRYSGDHFTAISFIASISSLYPGKISMNKEDVTEYTETASGNHRYLTVTTAQADRIREAFVHLVSSPPGK